MTSPITSPIQQNPIPQQKVTLARNWWKISFFLLLFIIILVVGLQRSGIFVADSNRVIPTVTPIVIDQEIPLSSVPADETAGWKNYMNTKSGFEIKYPNYWEINKSSGSPPEFTHEQLENLSYIVFFEPEKWVEKDGTRISSGINTISIVIDMDDSGKPYSCQNYDIFKCWTNQPGYSNGNVETKKIFINNNEALEILYLPSNNSEGETQVDVVFQRGLHLYKFNLRCTTNDCKKTKHVFDQILTTFTYSDQVKTSLKPSDSDLPAAGICTEAIGDTAKVTINIDTPVPRCIKVLPSQKLEIINNSDQTISISLANYSAVIEPGKTYTLDKSFGTFLSGGVHMLSVSPYGGPEIWLKE